MIKNHPQSTHSRPTFVLAGLLFVLFQFFIQLSFGAVISKIMHDLAITALTAGCLGSAFYILYTSLQIPVGILFDGQNTRTLISLNALICSIGCLVFAQSHTIIGLFIGRLLMGAGSAFAFVGFSHILRQNFPLRQFAFVLGLSETLAFFITVIAMIGMGEVLARWGWRNFMTGTGIIGLAISFFCWCLIPPTSNVQLQAPQYWHSLLKILQNKKAWINGFFVSLSFTPVTVFGALWAIPFLQIKLSCTLSSATILDALFFLGAGVSCPLFGWLSTFFSLRKPLILSSCLTTAILLMIIIFAPIHQYWLIGLLMFLSGCTCGAYMLAFSIANELAPSHSLSTCTGFTNTLAMLGALAFQPFIGFLLDASNQRGIDSLMNYQKALLTIPALLFVASFLVFFLPEKTRD